MEEAPATTIAAVHDFSQRTESGGRSSAQGHRPLFWGAVPGTPRSGRNWCMGGAQNVVRGRLHGGIGTTTYEIHRWRSIRRVLGPRFALVTRSFDIDRAQREWSLAYPMSKFDAGQGNGRTPE